MILVPQTELDKALAADKARRGILDVIPKECFTRKQLRTGYSLSNTQSRLWLELNAVDIGRVGKERVYRLKTKRELSCTVKTIAG